MQKLIIQGGKPLFGSVRLGGAKNASFKLMIASLLGSGESRLLNLPRIDDVVFTTQIIRALGGKVKGVGERTLLINSKDLTEYFIPDKFGPKSRASSMFIPVLLARFGAASVPIPGGDKIGARPLNRHMEGLEKMGATVAYEKNRLVVKGKQLHGATYRFSKNSHTGTETLIMAGVLAKGKTVIENAAVEPEIDDLILFLNNMGAHIRRRVGRIIQIDGVKRLNPAIHRVMPDRNEAISYACAAIATKGDIVVENARQDHLEEFLEKLDEIGGGYEVGEYGVRFYYKGALRATDVVTRPHPGFMTDWQPLWATLMTQAKGASIIHEAIHPFRFQYVDDLVSMGAKITPHEIAVGDKEKFYNFNIANDEPHHYHAIKITGPTKLHGGTFTVPDLRAGATLAIAALIAKGTTTIIGAEHIDRGYESLDSRLQSMGARIERQEE